MNLKPPLLLASRSPRRRQLLAEAGFDPIVIDSGFDDARLSPPHEGIDGAEWAESLARLKAEAALVRLAREGIVAGTIVAADTVCVIDSRIEGQPRDRLDARRMLHAIRNREHSTITGVAVLTLEGLQRCHFADAARVTVGPITNEQIDEYLDSGEWQGKAGAYNLAERQAAGWPITCAGDPATVMGLPMRRLIPMLASLRTTR
jgi:septum formation protein